MHVSAKDMNVSLSTHFSEVRYSSIACCPLACCCNGEFGRGRLAIPVIRLHASTWTGRPMWHHAQADHTAACQRFVHQPDTLDRTVGEVNMAPFHWRAYACHTDTLVGQKESSLWRSRFLGNSGTWNSGNPGRPGTGAREWIPYTEQAYLTWHTSPLYRLWQRFP